MNRASAALFLAWLAAASGAAAADALPSYNVDLARTTVSGVSSGAYMAGQLHVAFSQTVAGAGLVAGGPYDCAEGLLANALNRCMATTLGTPDPARLLAVARELAARERIEDLSNLADDRVYIFSGTQDETVLPRVVGTAAEFYRLAGVPENSIKQVADVPAGHAMITEDFGGPCPATATPYINDCDYDQAGDILRHVYGPAPLNAPAAHPGGQIVAFDQGAFIADPPRHSMSETGYLYVPEACRDGAPCRVHVALHGCRQTTADIGLRFVERAGYNEWADTNRIIVLYPQGVAGPRNPRGCWDWWGYEGANYHLRTGRQAAAIMGMVNRLAGRAPFPGYCVAHTDWNTGHWWQDRAHLCAFFSVCANGSEENLGPGFFRTTLYESSPGRFSTTDCRG